MPRSRLRLRLAAWFALGILLGLAVLDAGLYLALARRAGRALDRDLATQASELARAVQREAAEPAATGPVQAARDALDEFPATTAALVILDPARRVIVGRGSSRVLAVLSRGGPLPEPGTVLGFPLDEEGGVRAASAAGPSGLLIVALRSTASLVEELESLRWSLLASVPVVLLVSLPVGYLLARRALWPFAALARDLEAMQPDALDRRLPVADPPDELDQVTTRVNDLLDRLAASQRQTRRFLSQAAHQLRTPLTLIRGESDLALGQPRSAEQYQAALDRIRLAADQMGRRVDELFLLARAEAGEVIARREPVELDGVALAAVDLMRGRAQRLGHRLRLDQVDPAEVLGDEQLLREAAVELLENACRHGTLEHPITVAVRCSGETAALEVASSGPPAEVGVESADDRLGLTIVRWIARAHTGQLEHVHQGVTNLFRVVLPRATPES